MAEGGNNPPRGAIEYRQGWQRVVAFVDDNLGNGRTVRRPDDTDWKMQRRKTLRTLRELRQKIDNLCINCNYGKCVGSGSSAAGSVTSIVGSIMALRGIPAANAVMNVGNLLNHSGNVVSGVSGMIESAFTGNYLGNVQDVLKDDQRLSEPLLEWLQFSQNMEANLEFIFGCNLETEKRNCYLKILHEFSKLCVSGRSFQSCWNLLKQGQYSVHVGSEVKMEYLRNFFTELNRFPDLQDAVRTTLSVLTHSVHAVEAARSGVNIYRFLYGEPSGSCDVIPLRGGINPEIPTTEAVTTFCVFQGINAAANFCAFLSAASIIRDGKSKYSDALRDIISLLELELQSMERGNR